MLRPESPSRPGETVAYSRNKMRLPIVIAARELATLFGLAYDAAAEAAAQRATAKIAAARTTRIGMCLKSDTSGLELMHRP
jgi:hypothetical protein